jgi:hypothetical protein
MRVHPLNLLIALMVAGLLSFGLASADANAIKGTLAVGSFLLLGSTLGTALGMECFNQRAGVFCFGQFSQTSYVVVNGIFFLGFVLAGSSVASAPQ